MRALAFAFACLATSTGCSLLFDPSTGLPDASSVTSGSSAGSSGATDTTDTTGGSTGGGDSSSTTSAGSTAGTTGDTGTTTGSSSTGGTTSGTTGAASVEIVGVATENDAAITDVVELPDGTLVAASGGQSNQLDAFDAVGDESVYANSNEDNFQGPSGLCVYGSGSGAVLYVTDEGNNAIDVIDAAGTKTTLTGGGVASNADGPLHTAEFDAPDGIVAAPDGTLYVADTYNHEIRKITSTEVSTLAGSGNPGYVEGTGPSAYFNFPEAVSLDADGNVYVADSANKRIRKVTPARVTSTVATSPGRPYGVAVGGDGYVYFSDLDNSKIMRAPLAGGIPTVVSDDPAISSPRGMHFDAQGRLLVANTGNGNLLRLTLP